MRVPEPIRSTTGETADVAVTVAEAVQHFITAMDAVKLESRFVDQLQPLLSDLMDSLTRLQESEYCNFWIRIGRAKTSTIVFRSMDILTFLRVPLSLSFQLKTTGHRITR